MTKPKRTKPTKTKSSKKSTAAQKPEAAKKTAKTKKPAAKTKTSSAKPVIKAPAKKPATKKLPPQRLGRGLSALMADIPIEPQQAAKKPPAQMPATKIPSSKAPTTIKSEATKPAKTQAPKKGQVLHVAMDQLVRNPEQPRRFFDKDLLDELSSSIKDKGVLQPILVRNIPKRLKKSAAHDKPIYQIIAGERRWQAALKAGLDAMPVFVREITDVEALEIGVVENVQRADLNPMEEALAYQALTMEFGRSQHDIGQAVGKSRSYIANMLRLINLPSSVQDYLAKGKISTGHARAIIAAPDPAALADKIVDDGLSVRHAEKLVRKLKAETTETAGSSTTQTGFKDADTKRVEAQLMDHLGLVIDIRQKGDAGELRIHYKNFDQLDDLIGKLSKI